MDEISRFFAGRTILVTGCHGYIGSSLIRALRSVDCSIIGLSRQEKPQDVIGGAGARLKFLQGDLSDTSFLEKALAGVDVVFHFAAQTSTYVSNTDPRSDMNSNVLPMLGILEVCRKNKWSPGIVFAGAVTEVGVTERYPVDETFKDHPVTVYDLHKLFSESYLEYYAKEGIVKGTTLRLSNIYGPGPRSSSSDRGILNKMIRRALSGESLTIYGDGCYQRDYVFIDDAVQAFLLAAARIDSCSGRHFVVASGEGRSIADAMRMVARIVGEKTSHSVTIENVPPPPGMSPIESRNFVGDSTLLRTATGWRCKTSFEEGISRTVDYFIEEVQLA